MNMFSPSARGFFRTDLHDTIPADAVEITDAEHAALLDAQANGRPIIVVDGKPASAPAPTEAALTAAAKTRAHQTVQRAIEDWMRLFTAGVPAAEVASWPTKAEAAAAHLDGEPAAAILTCEADLTGETTAELATKIALLSAVYTSAIARAAAVRRNARDLIEAAATTAAVDAALASALADIAAAAAGLPLPSQSEETPE